MSTSVSFRSKSKRIFACSLRLFAKDRAPEGDAELERGDEYLLRKGPHCFQSRKVVQHFVQRRRPNPARTFIVSQVGAVRFRWSLKLKRMSTRALVTRDASSPGVSGTASNILGRASLTLDNKGPSLAR